jgi:hypothetical protein
MSTSGFERSSAGKPIRFLGVTLVAVAVGGVFAACSSESSKTPDGFSPGPGNTGPGGPSSICPPGQSGCQSTGPNGGPGSGDMMSPTDISGMGGLAACTGPNCPCAEGQTSCNGTCTSVMTDARNCGTCGNVCSGMGAGCQGGVCSLKQCAAKATLATPVLATFETYDGVAAADMWAFSFNTPAVYSGAYQYSDGTGAQTISMVAGNNSRYAVGISNTSASGWGGALGMWMGCIDASSFDGISFSVRGAAPGNTATIALNTEDTNAPDAMNAEAGGTCLAGCQSPSAAFPVAADWQRVLIPWSTFTPGAANQVAIPTTGSNIAGLTFSVALEWIEDPNAAGSYIPAATGYNLAIDDVQFFKTAEVCQADQAICDSACVDLQSSAAHCGACGNACAGGSTCQAGSCVCPNGLTFCSGECVNLASNTSHCGECGNFCSIGSACNGGTCAGGNGNTSNRCGETTRRLGNPLGCDFAWGANVENNIPTFLDFATKWVGYERNINTTCDGCTWLSRVNAANVVPVYIAYFIAYRANIESGFGDCNLDFDNNNLCTRGAQWIRDNRQRLISVYESYAARSYAASPNRPVVWILEPDFSQYAEGSQQNPLSMTELGQLASDIACAIKSNMPNAVIALNHSTWMAGNEYTQFWNAMPIDLVDMIHVTSQSNVPGGYFNNTDANNRVDGTFRNLRQLTGRPLLADTSFGVTTMADTWSAGTAANLNARIADGVVGALVEPMPGNYQQRIQTLAGLNSTCQ